MKKFMGIRVEPWVHRELRILAARWGIPLGEVLEAFVNFLRDLEHLPEGECREIVFAMLQDAFSNTGEKGDWTPEV